MKGATTYQLLFFLLITVCLFLFVFRKRKKKPVTAEQREAIKAKIRERTNIAPGEEAGKFTKDTLLQCVADIKLPDSITRLLLETCDDAVMQKHRLDREYSCPYSITDLRKSEQAVYHVDRYKPVLAYGHATIFAYDIVKQGFITYDIESSFEPSATCLTWDGVFVSEILRWWEYGIPDEDILHIGKYFGLKHTGEILHSIYTSTRGKGFADYKSLEAWEAEVLIRIRGIL